MPIYEFRCLKCQECFELLIMNNDGEIETRCPKCKSEDFERILSTTSHTAGYSSGGSRANRQTRTCSSGTCTTYDIPGLSR